ncbi:hypothetical protein Rs2_18640 [Raphanus sativus]|nr:hypothetical protein Rs2_18640 [Raphanus sativus]
MPPNCQGPPPKLLRSNECEALQRAYMVDMLLLDPKDTYCQVVVTATMVLERPDGKFERFYCTVSASEVVKSHPDRLSSSPPTYLNVALSASSESTYFVLLIISCSDMYIHSSLPMVLTLLQLHCFTWHFVLSYE